jgi:precorrin-2 dehydrogenase/sirohydrochlorin ferrochelatase
MNPRRDIGKKHFPYPVSLNLEGVPCVVVGGGAVALRKVRSLLSSGAKVTLISPRIIPEIEALGEIEITNREFQPGDLQGKMLVISATNDRSVNETVAKAARERNMLVNVVDVPELCSFFVNSQVRRGDLTISVSTGGASPALSKRIRHELESRYGDEYEGFLLLMREYRPSIVKEIPDPEQRKRMFERLVSARIEDVYREQGEAAARKAIERIVGHDTRTPGKTEQKL